MMADRNIPFKAPMIQALLDGRKTQTRRIIKDRGVLPEYCGGRYDGRNDPSCWGWEDFDRGDWVTLDEFRGYRFVPHRPGDRLYVREAWKTDRAYDDLSPSEMGGEEPLIYLADNEVQRSGWTPDPLSRWGRYRHARFMPRWASRLTLIVTDVRVQRLQDISEKDARAEGIKEVNRIEGVPIWQNYLNNGSLLSGGGLISATASFLSLWNSIHGTDAWDRNDWVYALTFTVHRQNIDQMGTPETRGAE